MLCLVNNVALPTSTLMKKADLFSVLTTHTYTKTKQKGKELLAVMGIFITMIVVMVS